MSYLSLTVQVEPNVDLFDALRAAQELATRLGLAYVKFNFAGRLVQVSSTSDVNQMERELSRDYQEWLEQQYGLSL